MIMKVLSLFDWISCARLALDRAGITVEEYYASEVDKYSIQVSTQNYPDIVQLGSVVWYAHTGEVDLLIGGSPCQDLSIAKQGRKWLDGERSWLFWEYVRILKEVKPKYFILENVNSMPKEAKAIITEALGVEPIMINASLVSAQNRKRLFWTNIPNITQPADRGILLKDILEQEVDEKYNVNADFIQIANPKWSRIWYIWKWGQWDRIYGKLYQSNTVYGISDKSVTLSANWGGRWAKTGLYVIPVGSAYDYYNDKTVPNGKVKVLGTNPQSTTAIAWQLVNDDTKIRKLTPTECERLQGVPDWYTEWLSTS